MVPRWSAGRRRRPVAGRDRQRRLHPAAGREVAARLVEDDALGANGRVALPQARPAGVGAAPLAAVVVERRGAGEHRLAAVEQRRGASRPLALARAGRLHHAGDLALGGHRAGPQPDGDLVAFDLDAGVGDARAGVALAAAQHQPVVGDQVAGFGSGGAHRAVLEPRVAGEGGAIECAGRGEGQRERAGVGDAGRRRLAGGAFGELHLLVELHRGQAGPGRAGGAQLDRLDGAGRRGRRRRQGHDHALAARQAGHRPVGPQGDVDEFRGQPLSDGAGRRAGQGHAALAGQRGVFARCGRPRRSRG